MNTLESLDPKWAWSRYEPSAERPWNRSSAAHLFRRAAFGANLAELDAAVSAGPHETISKLLGATETARFQQDSEQLARGVLATNDPKNLAAWWLHRILQSPQPLVEKMTLFWHGHFATSAEKVTESNLMFEQNQLLRKYALGDFSKLALEISRDAAMLIYLDSVSNRKAHPNENYARELMELFCLGEGNYSEKDVQELARCFTGWEIKRGKFKFNQYQHDVGMKTILGKSGEFGGEQAVDVVVANRAMPRFIVLKIIRYLVCDEPPIPDSLIDPLADEFRANGLDVGKLVERILRSQLFFSPHSVGRKIKSPVDLLVGFLRSLEGSTNVYNLGNDLNELGHALFFPPNVKGWDGGRTWINSSTLLARANAVYRLLHDENTRFGQQKIGGYLARFQGQNPQEVVARLHDLLFAIPLSENVGARLSQLVKPGTAANDSAWLELIHVMATLPEFQFG